eukprot:Rmarinus@m.1104
MSFSSLFREGGRSQSTEIRSEPGSPIAAAHAKILSSPDHRSISSDSALALPSQEFPPSGTESVSSFGILTRRSADTVADEMSAAIDTMHTAFHHDEEAGWVLKSPDNEKHGFQLWKKMSSKGDIIVMKSRIRVKAPPLAVKERIQDSSRRFEWDRLYQSSKMIESYGKDYGVYHLVFKMPPPFSSRDAVMKCKWERWGQEYYLGCIPVTHRDYPPDSSGRFVRAHVLFLGFGVAPVTPTISIVTYLLKIDLCGNIPSSIANVVVRNGMSSLLKFRKVMSKEDLTAYLISYNAATPLSLKLKRRREMEELSERTRRRRSLQGFESDAWSAVTGDSEDGESGVGALELGAEAGGSDSGATSAMHVLLRAARERSAWELLRTFTWVCWLRLISAVTRGVMQREQHRGMIGGLYKTLRELGEDVIEVALELAIGAFSGEKKDRLLAVFFVGGSVIAVLSLCLTSLMVALWCAYDSSDE